jgi:hypothetical protein
VKQLKEEHIGEVGLDWHGQAPEHVEGEGNIAQDKKIGTLRSGDLRVGMAKPPNMSRGRDRKSSQGM